MPLLQNHVAVVTGAASGIGRAIALGYGREGARLVLLDINEKGAAEAAQDPDPVAPEEAEQHDRRREVRRDEKGDEERVVLADVPAEELRRDHAVAEARDREELREALEQAEGDRLSVRDRHERRLGGCPGAVVARLEPGEDEAREAEQEGGDPVLHVVVAGALLVSGYERGQRLRRLRPVEDRERDEHEPGDDGRDDQLAPLRHAAECRARRLGGEAATDSGSSSFQPCGERTLRS